MAQPTGEKLERLMEYYASNYSFNGSVLVARGGDVLLSKGYGYRDVEKKIKNTDESIYQIGSNTCRAYPAVGQ